MSLASARLELARVLARRDSAAFGAAFEELRREQARDIRVRVEAGEMDDAASLPARRVFVEGLGPFASSRSIPGEPRHPSKVRDAVVLLEIVRPCVAVEVRGALEP